MDENTKKKQLKQIADLKITLGVIGVVAAGATSNLTLFILGMFIVLDGSKEITELE